MKRYGTPEAERKTVHAQFEEVRCLKTEFKRVKQQHDILKKAAVYSAKTSG